MQVTRECVTKRQPTKGTVEEKLERCKYLGVRPPKKQGREKIDWCFWMAKMAKNDGNDHEKEGEWLPAERNGFHLI